MPEPPFEFDVFLSHNSRDKAAIMKIAEILERDYHLKPWLDVEERIAGTHWQEMLEEGLRKSKTVAVFVGEQGFGKWELQEVRVAVNNSVESGHQIRVIPVMLPGTPEDLKMPGFLTLYGKVDLRNGYETKDSLSDLVLGIRGQSRRQNETASSDIQGLGQSADELRQLRTENVQPESNKGIESSQQSGRNPFRRDDSANPKPPSTEELIVSRKQLQDLHQAQHTLQDFLDGYIKFGELWAACEKAKSKLWEQLESQTEDISGLRYWDEMKDLMIHAQSKVSGEVPEFLQQFPRSKNQFSQFNQALDDTMRLLEAVQPKTAKAKKHDIISKAYEHMRTAVIMAKAILTTCQEGAKDQLKEISVVMDTIFETQAPPGTGISGPTQDVHRSIPRVQISDNRAERTTQQVRLLNR